MFSPAKSELHRKEAELLEVNARLQKGLEVLLDRDSLRRDGTLRQKLQELHSSLTTVGVVGHVPCSTASQFQTSWPMWSPLGWGL